VLGVTSEAEPFLTVDIDLEDAVRAKGTYPRDVFMQADDADRGAG
jgi:hypothetical protein